MDNVSKEDVSPEKKIKKRAFLVDYLRDYTSNTSLHGLQYIGEPATNLVERIFWFVMFTLSVFGCAMLIKNLWTKWDQTPVIVSFGEKTTPVWQVPFPAVTICSKNCARKDKYDYVQQFIQYKKENLTELELEMLEDVSLLCDKQYVTRRDIGNSSIVKNFISVAPDMDRLFFMCQWRENMSGNCEDLFTRVLTNKGLCFSFNSLSADEIFRTENLQKEYSYTEEKRPSRGWSPEQGYTLNMSVETYPRRGRNFGARPDLILTIAERYSDLNPMCDGPVRGFEVLLHNPTEKPRLSQYYIEVRPGEEQKVAIKLHEETISESLKAYDPADRQCYFPSERQLRYFKIYNQKNCELECRSNYTFAMCGCVSFYMPHNDSNQICAGAGMFCVASAKEALADSFIEDEIIDMTQMEDEEKDDEKAELLDRIAEACQCLPACTFISYEADTSSSKIDLASYISSFDEVNKETDNFSVSDVYAGIMMSRISFFFKESQFISVRRSELYGPTDFLANCGGLLGLFHGFSVLSLIEIIYYMTLRLLSVIRRSRVTIATTEEGNIEQKKF